MRTRPTTILCLVLVLLAAILLAGCNDTAAPAPTEAVIVEEVTTATPVPPADTPTPVPPTAVPTEPSATATSEPPTATPEPPTATPVPPTTTPEPPTATPKPPTATPEPEPSVPQAVPKSNMNMRGGPGTGYAVVGSATGGTAYEITGKNEDSSWYEVASAGGDKGWLSASLVTVEGDAAAVAVAENIPELPPTPTPAPTTAASATTAPSGGGGSGSPRGVLLYSVANMDAGKWELHEYNFASGEHRWLFDWRTEVEYSSNYGQIAYFAWPGAVGRDQYGIWVMNADYSGEHLVIRGGEYPSWSPDSSRLSAGDGETIYILNADGSGLRPLTSGEYPAWSPNSNWIAHRACVGGACGIYLTNPDTGEQRRLTTGGSDGQPAWSPNGQQIAYISQDDGNFEIYRINADGSNKVRLTNSPNSDGLPVWSPDGGWIAFRSDRGGGWAIYAVRADGSDLRKVVDASVLPVWFYEKMGWRP